jgi:DNA-binding NarL/FixJ family response regulator
MTRLTEAEEAVKALVMQGLSAKDIARKRGSSFNTVRSQIQTVLEKSGKRSQRELIAAHLAKEKS